MKFWNDTHPLSAEVSKLSKELVPSRGPAPSVGGEIMRAISSIYYDHYNNGSANNRTGAWNYLMNTLEGPEFRQAMNVIRPVMNMDHTGDPFSPERDQALDKLVEIVYQHALELRDTPNNDDCHDWDEENRYPDEDDDDDWYSDDDEDENW